MTAESATIHLVRQNPSATWGFRLQGGRDYLAPLIVGKVNPGSIAEESGLREGDYLREIHGQPVDDMTHRQAQEAIMNCGNQLRLFVERTSARIWAPSVKPVVVGPGEVASTPVKYSLEHDTNQQPPKYAGAKHNVAAKPFDPQVVVEVRQETTDEPAYLKSATLRLIHESEQNDKGAQPLERPKAVRQDHLPQNLAGLPPCSHCGRFIQGVFCKAADKQLHPECFVCATCGSNLKYKGYYVLGGKLYCDIHARQLTENPFKATPPVDPSVFAFKAPPMPLSPNRSEPVKASYQPEILKKGHILQAPKATAMSPSTRGVPTYSPGSGGRYTRVPEADELEMPGYPIQRGASPTHLLTPVQNLHITDSQKFSSLPSGEPRKTISAEPVSNPTRITAPFVAPKRGRGVLKQGHDSSSRVPLCKACYKEIRGPFVLALNECWCPDHFVCSVGSCRRKLLDIGFVEYEDAGKVCCEFCYEKHFAPLCAGCNRPIVTDCLNAVQSHWHPDCFKCIKCHRSIGNGIFFAQGGQIFCEDDWNKSFTTKCAKCHFPIESGDKYVEALDKCFHADCFNCSVCQKSLEGQSFYGKGGRPYCQNHV